MSCQAALSLSNNFHRPEGLISKRIVPKPVSIFLAVISGAIKLPLFIVTSALGTLGFAARALIGCAKGENVKPYVGAALLNLAGFASCIGFFMAAAFVFPFPITCGLLITAIAVSIIYHVIKACKE